MAVKTVSSLESHLGYWLRAVSNSVSYSFARKVEGEGVTVAEWVFMRSLFDVDELAPNKLAEAMGMTRGAISKLSDRLIAKGLVTRSAHPSDARTHTLALTPEGQRKVPELARLADANDEELFDVLLPGERQALEETLKKIAERRGIRDVPVD